MKKLGVVLLALVLALLVGGTAHAQQNYEVNLNSPTLNITAYDGCVIHAQLYSIFGAGVLKGGVAYVTGGSICRLQLNMEGTVNRTQTAEHEVGYMWIDEEQGSFDDARYTVIIDYPSGGD